MQDPLQKPANHRGRALVYLRVSTDEQAERGAGLGAQLDACRSYAARQRLEVLGPYSDEGISGAAPLDRRPGLLEATRELERGDVLLVAKRDRLGRDPIVVAMIEAAAIRSGGRVVSAAGEGTDGDGPSDILMRRIVDAFAEFERVLIRGRTKAALGSLRRRGRVYSPIPYGYRAVEDGAGTKTSKGLNPGKLEPDPDEQKVVGGIRRMSDAGLSLRQIATRLEDLGVPTRRGGAWSHQSVAGILERDEAESVAHRVADGHPEPDRAEDDPG